MIDEDGTVSREVKLDARAKAALGKMQRHFGAVFGRPWESGDPYSLMEYLHSPDDLTRMVVEAMRKSGMPKDKIYAYEKTGVMPMAGHLDIVPESHLDDWDAAIAEYRKKRRPAKAHRDFQSLTDEIKNLLITIGYVIDKTPPTDHMELKYSDVISVEHYVLFCLQRAARTLRSLNILFLEQRTFDALALTRTLYELYLHVIFVQANPHHLRDLVDAQLGLKTGTHRHGRNKKNRVVIVETATGREFAPSFSRRKMSRAGKRVSDEQLFDLLYDHLSSFIHPNFFEMSRPTGEGPHTDRLSEDEPHEAVFYTILFTCMLLDETRRQSIIPPKVVSDITRVLLRVREKAVTVNKAFRRVSPEESMFEIYEARLREIAT